MVDVVYKAFRPRKSRRRRRGKGQDVFAYAKKFLDMRTMVSLEKQSDHGSYLSGVCPFHDDESPSFLVFADGWNCLAESCPRKRGSSLDWLAYTRGMDSPTPAELYALAKSVVDLHGGVFFDSQDEETEEEEPPRDEKSEFVPDSAVYAYYDMLGYDALAYLAGRGFTENFVRWNRWGWTGDSIVFPVWSGFPGRSGVWTFRFRSLYSSLRYYGVRDRNSPYLFNAWVRDLAIIGQLPFIYVFYGEFDSALAVQNLIPAVSPTNGCRAFDAGWLAGYGGKVIFVPDVGEEDAAYRDAQDVGFRASVFLLPQGHGKDFTDIVTGGGDVGGELIQQFRDRLSMAALNAVVVR